MFYFKRKTAFQTKNDKQDSIPLYAALHGSVFYLSNAGLNA